MWNRWGKPCAVAHVTGGRKVPCVSGRVSFYKRGNNVLVVADIRGLPETETQFFAMHIHEGGSCQGIDFENTQGHYNPAKQPHPMHPGDLPTLLSWDGRAFLAVLTGRFSISEILGKTVVIHSGPDDFHSQPSGNAGEKIACGVILPC